MSYIRVYRFKVEKIVLRVGNHAIRCVLFYFIFEINEVDNAP